MQFSSSSSFFSLKHLVLGVSLGLGSGTVHAQEEINSAAEIVVPTSTSGVAAHGIALKGVTTALVQPPSANQETGQELKRPSFEDLGRAMADYADAIAGSEKLTISEIVEIRKVMEDSILLPIIVHGGLGLDAGRWLEPPLHSLYEALLSKIDGIELSSSGNFFEMERERLHHYTQIVALFRVVSAGSKAELGKILLQHYGGLDKFTVAQIFSDVACNALNDPEFVSRFLIGNFDQILESAGQRLERFHRVVTNPSEPIEYLITLPNSVRVAISRANGFGIIDEQTARNLDRRVQDKLVTQVVPSLVPLWISAYRQVSGYKSDFFDDWAFRNPMALEQTRFQMDYLTQRVGNLLTMWEDDRNKLGNIFFDQIDNLLVTRGLSDVVGYMALVHLPAMAPDPERKSFLVDALRVGLLSDAKNDLLGETADRPTQIARVLGICLISDHAYFATAANSNRYDPEILIDLARGIGENPFPPERYNSVLTPAQKFFLELMTIARGVDDAKTIEWIRPFDEASKHKLVERARVALKRFALDFYEFQPHGIFQGDTFRADNPIGTAKSWGTSPMIIPDREREADWRLSLTGLFSYPDLVCEQRVQLAPHVANTYHLSIQLSDAVEVLRCRESLYERGEPGKLCGAARLVHDLYSQKKFQDQPSKHRDVFDELGLAIMEFARDQDKGSHFTGGLNKYRDAADRYIDLAQRVCILDFVTREVLNASAKDAAVLGATRRWLMGICEVLGFIETEPRLAEFFEADDLDQLLCSLYAYREDLASEMADRARELGF